MSVELATYWSITINNPDENDWIIVQNPNDKYIREQVWTQEQGKEGTVHVQMWIRCQRNERMSLIKKLYPRAHTINVSKSSEYSENTRRYCQKNDDTTRGNHHIVLLEPRPDPVTIILQVLRRWNHPLTAKELLRGEIGMESATDEECLEFLKKHLDYVVNDMVLEKPYLAKLFVSPIYEKTLVRFWKQFLRNIYITNVSPPSPSTSPSSSRRSSLSSSSEVSSSEDLRS